MRRLLSIWPWIGCSVLLIVLAGLGSAAFAHDQEFEGEGVGGGPLHTLAPCIDGAAFIFPCSATDLVAWVPPPIFGDFFANDVWGWTDPETGREYAILGHHDGTAFFDLADPAAPIYLGTLPTQTVGSSWRDIKTYADHAFIVSEAKDHGLQIFDLRQLRDVATPPSVFAASANYDGFGNSHNIAINEETGIAYAVGTSTCAGGLHALDIRQPLAPQFIGCFSEDGYTHDAQCVTYRGPDREYEGREICFNANEDSLTIADLSHPRSPRMLSRNEYATSGYTHQGWLTEDHHYFLLGDELDERAGGLKARTYVWDVSDLEAPFLTGSYVAATISVDHNIHIVGNHAFEANYLSGLRVLRLGDLSRADIAEVAFFDTTPGPDGLRFEGAWGVYPFFESGIVLISDINNGLFVLAPHLGAVPECSDGIDNDSDGLRDFPEDASCADADGASEAPRNDVAIDILPNRSGKRPKPGSAKANGAVRIAVLGAEGFDVRTIDRSTLRFGPGEARARLDSARYRDSNGDGELDLVAHYSRRDAALHLASGSDAERACLSWSTQGGASYRACDSVPPSRGPRH